MWLSVIDIVHALEFCTMWYEMLNQRNRNSPEFKHSCVWLIHINNTALPSVLPKLSSAYCGGIGIKSLITDYIFKFVFGLNTILTETFF